jgi:tetratricopeptide (TPR) repeat protein
MRMCDALGAYGIAYVEDPDSPVSRSLGKAEIVDTVRFPRTTLYNRTGDCDDTTALLGSLLESVGIRTAILTTPGHIFLAFDSGEPAENAQYLSDAAHEAMARGGSAWIPVETTLLSKGFMAAWASATELVKRYGQTGPFEFLPLAGMRDSFPALPLPPSSIIVAEPAKASVDRAYAASVDAFTDALYSGRVKEMEARLASLSGRQAIMARLRVGILHALFGRMTDAEASFRKAIGEDPTLISPYVNLANLRLLADDAEGALQVVKQGLARNRESALLNLLAARIYAGRGDARNTAVYYARLKAANPDLAARYAELSSSAGTRTASGGSGGTDATQRAEQPGGKPVVIWGDAD